MPELPEVETVKEGLKKRLLNKTIIGVDVLFEGIIEYPSSLEFKKNLIGQTIIDIKRRGKWLLFLLNDYYLISHLRMEGKYFIKDKSLPIIKHEHVIISFKEFQLRYQDTRKFGKMALIKKDEINNYPAIKKLGYEPWDKELTVDNLKHLMYKSKMPIKTLLLDQTIISGIGNIYADEILFLSKLNPLEKVINLKDNDYLNIIENTKFILEKAIKLGGSTIHSYQSVDGITGRFQNELLVHTKSVCSVCGGNIDKIVVGGRGTYYCLKCQNKR